jgi:tetratricopeptide (TPR) repeat protein
MQLRIPVTDLYAAPGFVGPEGDVALNAMRLAELYSFLPLGTSSVVEGEHLVVTCPDLGGKRNAAADDAVSRGSRRARAGDHIKAVDLLRRGLSARPLLVSARRDLAMALMAAGDKPGAETELRRLLLLDPRDAWAWVILGNLTFRQNFALAERYFRRAVELAPTDAYAWNGMGAMYLDKRDYPQAIAAFEAALHARPGFPNAAYGLATALRESGDDQRAFDTVTAMLAAGVIDARSLPVLEQGRQLFRQLAGRLTAQTMGAGEAEVEALTREAERMSGFKVKFEDADASSAVTASCEMAWKYGRDHHVIRVRPSLGAAVQLHQRAHELCHIIMEAEARAAGTNRWFSANDDTRAHALREIEGEISAVRRSLPPEVGDRFIERVYNGLLAQLYNLPLDMLIEQRLATRHPGLRFAQIETVSTLLAEAEAGCTLPDIVRLTPRRILHAARFLCACYAAFVDRLYSGALSASARYQALGVAERGSQLLALWDAKTAGLKPGAGYELVDAFAQELRLTGWYRWVPDLTQAVGQEGVSNPSALATRADAAEQHFVEILARFDAMPKDAIKFATAEAAMAGQSGLDYSSPVARYQVPSFSPESLSGLAVMCVLYAGLKHLDPTKSVEIDLHTAYEKALARHRGQG